MTRRSDEEDLSAEPGVEEAGATLRQRHALLLRWGTSREIGARIAELRRIASWWASKEMPEEDDDAGRGFDAALKRLTRVRQAAIAVEAALEEAGYEFDGYLRVLRGRRQPSSGEDRPSERAQQLLSETILEVIEELDDEGQPNENTGELRLQVRARLARCLHPDLLSDGSIKTVLDQALDQGRPRHG